MPENATIKYPHVRVQLTGRNGNTMVMVGRVRLALREAGASPDEVAEFTKEALSGDYDHALRTIMSWVNAE